MSCLGALLLSNELGLVVLGRVACVADNERLEVKKVRPVKTMWPSLIPTSDKNAAERTTRAARPAPGYISADKHLNCPVSDSSVRVSQAGRFQQGCLCDYCNSQFALVVLYMCCVLFFHGAHTHALVNPVIFFFFLPFFSITAPFFH